MKWLVWRNKLTYPSSHRVTHFLPPWWKRLYSTHLAEVENGTQCWINKSVLFTRPFSPSAHLHWVFTTFYAFSHPISSSTLTLITTVLTLYMCRHVGFIFFCSPLISCGIFLSFCVYFSQISHVLQALSCCSKWLHLPFKKRCLFFIYLNDRKK